MKFLFDLFPVLLFFVVYKVADMFPAEAYAFVNAHMLGLVSGGKIAQDQGPMMVATAVAILASILQVGYVLARRQKVDMMLWVSVIVIVVFGGATIYLHDDHFIKWKPTILNWIYAAVIAAAQLLFGKNIIREVMKEAIALPDEVWDRLSWLWIGFFTVAGAVNLLVAFVIFKDQTSSWVSFKAFGLPAMTFAFAIVQSLYVAKHIQEDKV
ncbi:septation protein A [Massilia arenosa]|uniref:Inner membrane-spanning protein YciB n=1 Tax=Zemynaea arenosa TaxID=2561931 RepID=A0A4Y9RT70_9BURK|nr:septation protein A [Massilia arenosa]TFW11481.1 septation protein A [Massilia arenosa]